MSFLVNPSISDNDLPCERRFNCPDFNFCTEKCSSVTCTLWNPGGPCPQFLPTPV